MIVDYNIENEEGMLIQRKRNYCSKLKKGKLKNWKTLLSILDEKEPSVQSTEQVWSWGNTYFNLPSKTWKVIVTASISENKYLVGSMPGRTPSNNIWKYLKWSFIQQKGHLSLWPCSIDNTLNRPSSSAWESFNI